ncbi:hypothetical protein C1H46_034164 [Malus baccata]|uniref:Isopenicillin N synthase-like Fe(2+) 2OG dioxygenase domain-containing protein n=1 Tax=Malus baccata TaxID=106549 RepID=A0A540L1A3_MALBA|nr:hypothetical protein C1H46_034164 [Malus baccata]
MLTDSAFLTSHSSSARLYWWSPSSSSQEGIDVPLVPGALVVNIGDLLQDRFRSVEHTALADPRTSVASLFIRVLLLDCDSIL